MAGSVTEASEGRSVACSCDPVFLMDHWLHCVNNERSVNLCSFNQNHLLLGTVDRSRPGLQALGVSTEMISLARYFLVHTQDPSVRWCGFCHLRWPIKRTRPVPLSPKIDELPGQSVTCLVFSAHLAITNAHPRPGALSWVQSHSLSKVHTGAPTGT